MEKSKKISFNFGLYMDGLRQLKMIGIMGSVIMIISAFGIPIYYNIFYSDYLKNAAHIGLIQKRKAVALSILEMNPVIVITFLIIVPVMMLYIFNFLNRRNASDFYHSIPDTRKTLVISYGASVLTWNIAIIAESIIISFLSAAMLEYVQLRTGKVLVMFCALVAASIFIMGVLLIAMSMTGTNLNNVVVALMIIAVPRIFVTYIVFCITNAINVLVFSFGNSILDDRLNIVTNLVTGTLVRGEYEACYLWKSVIYTLIVGIIYCVVGMVLFIKRKSEAATCPAISPRMQALFRLIPAMMISLVPLYYFFQVIAVKRYNASFESEDIFVIVLMYIIAVVSIYLYEIITAGKLRNVKRVTKSIVSLVLYNIITFTVLVLGYNILLNDIPDVSSVKSVSIERYSDEGSYDYDESQYFLSGIADVDITSDEMKELIIAELNRCVEEQKSKSKSNTHTYSSNASIVRVVIDCGFTKKYRVITLSEEADRQFVELLSKEEKIKEVVYKVRTKDEVIPVKYDYIGEADIYAIYESYMAELKKMPFEKALGYILDNVPYKGIYSTLPVYFDNDKFFNMKLTSDFKDTMRLYSSLVNENSTSQPLETFLGDAQKYKEKKDDSYVSEVINLTIYNEAGFYEDSFSVRFDRRGDVWEYELTEDGEELLYEISSALTAVKDKPVDVTKKFIEIRIYKDDDINGEDSWMYYYPMNGELSDMISEFKGKR